MGMNVRDDILQEEREKDGAGIIRNSDDLKEKGNNEGHIGGTREIAPLELAAQNEDLSLDPWNLYKSQPRRCTSITPVLVEQT